MTYPDIGAFGSIRLFNTIVYCEGGLLVFMTKWRGELSASTFLILR